MKLLPFDPKRVPYQYQTTLGEREVLVRWTWNYVGAFFVMTLLDPETEQWLWRRPVRYGSNLLHGCTVRGLEGVVVVPADEKLANMKQGITLENATAIRMWMHEL